MLVPSHISSVMCNLSKKRHLWVREHVVPAASSMYYGIACSMRPHLVPILVMLLANSRHIVKLVGMCNPIRALLASGTLRALTDLIDL